MPTPHEVLVEKVARAICEATSGPFDLLSTNGQNACRGEARAAIATIYAAMREPSKAMWAEACDPQSIFKYSAPDERGGAIPLLIAVHYRAMIAASPLNPEARNAD